MANDTQRVKKAEYSQSDPSSYIDLDQGSINSTSTDLTLVGRTRVDYGLEYNENVLHLLENFASDEAVETQTETDFHAIPAEVVNPVDGQTWFNKTRKRMYVYFRGRWFPLAYSGDAASNWGTIESGQALPLPVGSAGQTFSYSECAWVVSPAFIPEEVSSLTCTTDPSTGVVTMEYVPEAGGSAIAGNAFYSIYAIRGNDYLGGNDAEGFKAQISNYIVQKQVPPLNTFPTTQVSDSVDITTNGVTGGNTLHYTWLLVSPTSFPSGYSIEPTVGYGTGTTSTTTFTMTVNSPGVFVSTQKTVRGATFVCRVEEKNGATVVNSRLTLPVRVEFYNF